MFCSFFVFAFLISTPCPSFLLIFYLHRHISHRMHGSLFVLPEQSTVKTNTKHPMCMSNIQPFFKLMVSFLFTLEICCFSSCINAAFPGVIMFIKYLKVIQILQMTPWYLKWIYSWNDLYSKNSSTMIAIYWWWWERTPLSLACNWECPKTAHSLVEKNVHVCACTHTLDRPMCTNVHIQDFKWF